MYTRRRLSGGGGGDTWGSPAKGGDTRGIFRWGEGGEDIGKMFSHRGRGTQFTYFFRLSNNDVEDARG